MSLVIDTRRVIRVLLADGWHDIKQGSFDLDAYEFMDGYDDYNQPVVIFKGDQSASIPSTGFTFIEDGVRIDGPLTSVLAVATQTGKGKLR